MKLKISYEKRAGEGLFVPVEKYSLDPAIDEIVREVSSRSAEAVPGEEYAALADEVRSFDEWNGTDEMMKKAGDMAVGFYRKMLELVVPVRSYFDGTVFKEDAAGAEDAGGDIHDKVFPVFRVREGVNADEGFIAIACKALRNIQYFCYGCRPVGGRMNNEAFLALNDLPAMILPLLEKLVEQKLDDYKSGRSREPLNLFREVTFLRALLMHFVDERLAFELFSRIERSIGKLDAATVCLCFRGSQYIEDLSARSKYREIVELSGDRRFGKFVTPQADALAKAKISSTIDYDGRGLPVTSDPSPQFPWADLNAYGRRFDEVRLPEDPRPKSGRFDCYAKGPEELKVDEQLAVFKRASVAELLRKLINRDMCHGDPQNTAGTKVGVLLRSMSDYDLDDYHYPGDFNDHFRRTAVPVSELFRPLYAILYSQMDGFGRMLLERFGEEHSVMMPRLKSPSSTILKMLKEGTTAALDITDMIGFTVLTETDAQAERVLAEIEDMMDLSDAKYVRMWPEPSKYGRKSLDITAVPKGFRVKMQVQCTTRKCDRINEYQLSSHEYYKYRTGKELLDKVNADPDRYLDMLYQALCNLRLAYSVVSQMPADDIERILMCYARDLKQRICIVRTSRLY